jgi:TetR/AcrR family transcriptional regulator, repressor for uid operon
MRTVDPEKVAEQRRAIVLAAVRAFSRVGLAESSIDDICREAGISPGRLYYYFKSKEALIDEANRFLYSSSFSASAAYFRDRSLVSALLASYDTTQSYMREVGVSNALIFEMMTASERNPNLRTYLKEGQDRWLKLFDTAIEDQKQSGILRAETDAKTLSLAIATVVTGAQALAVVSDRLDEEKIRAILSALVEPWLAAPSQPKKRGRAKRPTLAA